MKAETQVALYYLICYYTSGKLDFGIIAFGKDSILIDHLRVYLVLNLF